MDYIPHSLPVSDDEAQLADKVSIFVETSVTPAKAGGQVLDIALDSRLRGNDIYAELGLEIKFRRFVNTHSLLVSDGEAMPPIVCFDPLLKMRPTL